MKASIWFCIIGTALLAIFAHKVLDNINTVIYLILGLLDLFIALVALFDEKLSKLKEDIKKDIDQNTQCKD